MRISVLFLFLKLIHVYTKEPICNLFAFANHLQI